MNLFSLLFIFFFLPIAVIVYYALPGRFRNYALLAYSVLFLYFAMPMLLFLLALSTCFDYLLSFFVHNAEQASRGAKAAVLVVIVKDILLFAVLSLSGARGISFEQVGFTVYALCSISYIVDLYRYECDFERDFADFLLYNLMFWKLYTGPISSYDFMQASIKNRKLSPDNIITGVQSFVLGLFMKIVLADELQKALAAFHRSALQNPNMLSGVMTVIAATLWLFFNLWAFYNMARGLARIFGFAAEPDVSHPFRAKSVNEFLSKCMGTLSAFFRRYVYIPLGRLPIGGAISGEASSYVSILVSTAILGLCFSFTPPMLAFGLFLGIVICCERAFSKMRAGRLPGVLAVIVTNVIVCFSLSFFVSPSLGDWGTLMKAMFSFGNPASGDGLFAFQSYAVLIVLAALLSGYWLKALYEKIRKGRRLHPAWGLIGSGALLIVTTAFIIM